MKFNFCSSLATLSTFVMKTWRMTWKIRITWRMDSFGGMGSSRGKGVTDVAEGGREEVKDAGWGFVGGEMDSAVKLKEEKEPMFWRLLGQSGAETLLTPFPQVLLRRLLLLCLHHQLLDKTLMCFILKISKRLLWSCSIYFLPVITCVDVLRASRPSLSWLHLSVSPFYPPHLSSLSACFPLSVSHLSPPFSLY